MPSFRFELTDLPHQLVSHSMSAKDVAGLERREMTAVLQRQFLFFCDVLRKAGVPTDNLIAALLGASIQDYVEKCHGRADRQWAKKGPKLSCLLNGARTVHECSRYDDGKPG
jgi:hypothetical protein